jgi:hypothetical protein
MTLNRCHERLKAHQVLPKCEDHEIDLLPQVAKTAAEWRLNPAALRARTETSPLQDRSGLRHGNVLFYVSWPIIRPRTSASLNL